MAKDTKRSHYQCQSKQLCPETPKQRDAVIFVVLLLFKDLKERSGPLVIHLASGHHILFCILHRGPRCPETSGEATGHSI